MEDEINIIKTTCHAFVCESLDKKTNPILAPHECFGACMHH
jgi:hypothetical protein